MLQHRSASLDVTQPLRNLDMIPDNIPLIIGTSKNKGEMFVNYESNKVQWRPLCYLFNGEAEVEDGRFWQPHDFDEIFI